MLVILGLLWKQPHQSRCKVSLVSLACLTAMYLMLHMGQYVTEQTWMSERARIRSLWKGSPTDWQEFEARIFDS
jgi:hypothetical protein